MEAHLATVSQINGYIKKIFDSNAVLNNIWIKGEISNFKKHYSGHMYITLKDEGGVLKAVMFRSSAAKLEFMPADGMKVVARGRLTVYEAGGSYQLYIEEMRRDGMGDLYLAYEKLKKKLNEEGLFEQGYKKAIPKFPERVGVITATTGAAVRDIINVITRRYPAAEIVIYPSLVQGAGAAPDIIKAIQYFDETKCVDVIIAGRGGGSIEDLWAFNEEEGARAIFKCSVPIISAVGHETDFTIADFVADLRAPTPSAAAEIAVPSATELISRISVIKSRIINAQQKQNENRRLKIKALSLKSPVDKIRQSSMKADGLIRMAEQNINVRILGGKKRLGEAAARLNAMSPLAVMARGYSVASKEDGSIVRSGADLKPGEKFDLRLARDIIKCERRADNG